MAYNILGISIGHNSSACVLSDGELVYFLEEERLSRVKRDGNPFRVMFDICTKYVIDELVISGTNSPLEFNILIYSNETSYASVVRKFYPKVKVTYLNHHHHLAHTSISFFNSGFKKAIGIVIDAAGSMISSPPNGKWESESMYELDYKVGIKEIYKEYGTATNFNPLIGIGRVYSAVTTYLGFLPLDGGKTMGLSSYGKENKSLPDFFINSKGNTNLVITNPNSLTNLNFYPKDKDDYKWHKNFSKLPSIKSDIAYKIQIETQEEVKKLIEKAIKKTGLKQVCCSGGYFLNCVANYYLTKQFPNVEFYFEPIANDAGTSIGVAKLVWYKKTQKMSIQPQKTLYHGPKYSKEELLEGIKKYTNVL